MGICFAVPEPLETVSGGYAYTRQILARTPLSALLLPQGFPDPGVEALAETRRRLAVARGPLLIDGLAYGAFPAALADAVGPRAVVMLHHPLDLEGDVDAVAAAARAKTERRALVPARGVITSSAATARDLVARFGVEADRLAVVEPGVDPAPRSPVSGEPPLLISVGAMIPRKGHDLLVRALALLPETARYRLEIIGPLDRDAEHLARVRGLIAAAGLGDRVALTGPLSDDALAARMAAADIAVLPSRHEGYGMAATEAVARGVPVVAGRGGALADTASSGIVVDPEDTPAFAAALERLVTDPAARQRAADRAWAAAERLPRWEDAAAGVMAALERFLGCAVSSDDD
ncbi:MAG: glycosyltransferase family 4 protein [Pseudomonadota bacterium]